ncbi:hypothetical protein JB92DRAFT_2833132 [Gautieria morchelliformis]|nr:hypothetical protein JB92DRAFT_2833132 [Gautieria morchelliformis]
MHATVEQERTAAHENNEHLSIATQCTDDDSASWDSQYVISLPIACLPGNISLHILLEKSMFDIGMQMHPERFKASFKWNPVQESEDVACLTLEQVLESRSVYGLDSEFEDTGHELLTSAIF